MQVNINTEETLDQNKVKVSLSYDKEKVIQTKKDIAAHLSKTHQFPGFRKGKASVQAVLIHAKEHIEEQAKQVLANEAFFDLLFQKKWKPLGQPKVNSMTLDNTKFSVELEIGYMPDIQLTNYKDFTFEEPELPPKDNIVDRIKASLCEQHGELKNFTDEEFVLLEDNVIVDYTGVIDDKTEEAKDVYIKVGEGQFLSSFEEQLVGMKVGEEREIELNFDNDFRIAELAGKTGKYNVKLKVGMRSHPAEFNEELSKKLNMENFEKLQELVNNAAENNIKQIKTSQLKQQLVQKLLDANREAVVIPNWVLQDSSIQVALNRGKEWDKLNELEKEEIKKEAEESLKLVFILGKIKELEPETVLSQDEVLQIINQSITEEQAKYLQNNMKALQEMMTSVHHDYIVGWLLRHILKEDQPEQQSEEQNMSEPTREDLEKFSSIVEDAQNDPDYKLIVNKENEEKE